MEIPTGRVIDSRSESKQVIPKLLTERLEARKNARIYWLISLVFNIFLAIISGFLFDCYYFTRKYIINGDDFWKYYADHDLNNKAVPLNSMLSGMISILAFCFNLMNFIVIGLFVNFGGVRDRIKFASKFILTIKSNRLHEFIYAFFLLNLFNNSNSLIWYYYSA